MAKQFLSCKVLAVTPVSAGIFRLDCGWAGSPPANGALDAPQAGQFFMVKPERSGVFLPRPISAAFWDQPFIGKPLSFISKQPSEENPLSFIEKLPSEGKPLSSIGKPPADGTPLSSRTLSFLILRRGKGTEELAALRPGETIELSGPLGNCWEDFLPPAAAPVGGAPQADTPAGGVLPTGTPAGGVLPTGTPAGGAPQAGTSAGGGKSGRGKSCALIGGGIGIAPLLSLPLHYPSRFDFYAGFRTISEQEESALLGPIKPLVNRLIIAVELSPASSMPHTKTQRNEGMSGISEPRPELCVSLCKDRVPEIGRIPDFFDPAGYSAVCACGPEAMLRVVAEKCAAAGVPCYVSLERRMACGAGACLGCTVRTSEGNRRCCADGPIFPAGTVLFE